MNVEEKVIAIVADKLGRDVSEITPDKDFVQDLAADSLDRVELLMAFENEFKIKIPEEDQEKFLKVQDAIDFVTNATKAN
jgi:acyl carrier protein